MIGFVHRQHTDREGTYPARHPPAQAGGSAVLAHRKAGTVLENAAGELAGCGDPGFANDRKAHPYDRTGCSEGLEPGGGIAQVVLTPEIHAQHDHVLLGASATRWKADALPQRHQRATVGKLGNTLAAVPRRIRTRGASVGCAVLVLKDP